MSRDRNVPQLVSITRVPPSPALQRSPAGDRAPAEPQPERNFSVSSPNLGSTSFDESPGQKGYRFKVRRRKKTEVASTPGSAGDSQVQVGGFLSQPDLRKVSKEAKRLMKVELLDVPETSPAPADSLWTVRADGKVRLRMESSGFGATPARTVHSMFAETVRRWPYNDALAFKREPNAKGFEKITYIEYYRMVVTAAKSFIKLGLDPNHSVGIIGFNCVEWFVADLGAIFAGGFSCGIYTTNSPETCQFVAANANAQIIVAEDANQVKKILKVRKELPKLKAIVQWKGELADTGDDMLMTWNTFLEVGRDQPDSVVEARLRCQVPNQCCTLIYTSGTTGNPKGVMLSHDNLIWTARSITRYSSLVEQREAIISYLPLSHVAAQVVDIFGPLVVGGTVYFAQPDALKGSLSVTLKEVRPTLFLGVPRVWEKIQERLLAAGKTLSPSKKRISAWAKGIGLRGSQALMRGRRPPWGWSLAHLLVFNRLKRTLGLDRCRMCVTAAAPITKDTLDYFMSLTLPLMEVYGMSESTGPHTVSVSSRFRTTAVGLPPPGFNTRLRGQDEDGNGEVCMSSRNVFMGYLGEEAKTAETMDEEGWLLSGDVGRHDEEGFLYITGRIKELLITAGGENVAPVPIEDRLKEAMPGISNAMVIGDKRKFLSVLLTLKCELGQEGEPLDTLTPGAREWVREVAGCEVKTASEVCELAADKESSLAKAITVGLKRANDASTSRACCVQKWKLLVKDFSLPGGELGPTMKLRRPIVTKMYASEIDALYAGDE